MCVYIYIYICKCVYMYVYTYIYIYIYIYIVYLTTICYIVVGARPGLRPDALVGAHPGAAAVKQNTLRQ